MNYKTFSCSGFFIFDVTGEFVLLGADAKGHLRSFQGNDRIRSWVSHDLSPQKGGVDPGDDALFKCAIRETMEESGISAHELQFSEKEYIEYAPSGKANILYWLARLKQPRTEFKFDPEELKSVQWYETASLLKDMPAMLKPQRLEILRTMVADLPTVVWEDDVAQKRFLRCNPPSEKKKSPHDREARSLVKLLRHDLDSQKIRYDPAGYVAVPDVIRGMKKLDLKMIQEIVEYDNKYDKQRLDLKVENGVWKIRANQGHSLAHLKEEELLTELFEPLSNCFHGTERKFLNSINATGLSKMGRTHIHCISKDPKSTDFADVISGFKKQSNCAINIDMKKSLEAGHRWFRSKNGVLLTEGPLMPEFFLGVTDLAKK